MTGGSELDMQNRYTETGVSGVVRKNVEFFGETGMRSTRVVCGGKGGKKA